ncbi:uncharacterized protein BDR25DRAFT_360991 [Lindgomyces ingoldianus]|uniref:Uncharacterized protein n=1 Tax=Lindgomyces ingoldianus TaxID=673940 RepID=A0ACB6QDU1_9PLEO|nr:uncharacterized protein BDR25DRAFT_360991 [Lindgomyces ingoldianus]KAF2465091.1 hypothetical protein BDR25DRAFT_360991 [Lindgomyces ingoldianus]
MILRACKLQNAIDMTVRFGTSAKILPWVKINIDERVFLPKIRFWLFAITGVFFLVAEVWVGSMEGQSIRPGSAYRANVRAKPKVRKNPRRSRAQALLERRLEFLGNVILGSPTLPILIRSVMENAQAISTVHFILPDLEVPSFGPGVDGPAFQLLATPSIHLCCSCSDVLAMAAKDGTRFKLTIPPPLRPWRVYLSILEVLVPRKSQAFVASSAFPSNPSNQRPSLQLGRPRIHALADSTPWGKVNAWVMWGFYFYVPRKLVLPFSWKLERNSDILGP